MRKILLIGPLPDPITGLSIANQTVLDGVKKYRGDYKVDYINTGYNKLENLGSFSFSKLFFYSCTYFKLFKIIANDYTYITPGQTFFGVVKYAPFVYLAKLFKKKIIVHIHGNFLHVEYKNVSSWKKKLMHLVLSKSDKGIILSESLSDNLTPFMDQKKIYPLYNFVEDSLFANDEDFTIHTDYLRILYLSNLIAEKGIFDLLEALLILKENNIKFTAQIAGAIDSDNKDKVEKLLSKLSDNVKYLGVVRGKVKKEAFLSSNVFVFPTYYPMEGQPISILESMATGNIVLTTKHAGIPDIFEEGVNGSYINKNDPQDIANKLINLSENFPDQKNIMNNNKVLATQKYTVEKFINNFINILEK